MLQENRDLVNDNFLQTLNTIIAEGEARNQSPEMVEVLKSIYKNCLANGDGEESQGLIQRTARNRAVFINIQSQSVTADCYDVFLSPDQFEPTGCVIFVSTHPMPVQTPLPSPRPSKQSRSVHFG